MRLWSLHPRYLDAKGIVALWREALLAQAVLAGRTKGYRNHPQLARFRGSPDPTGAIGDYLQEVHAEATRRGYSFDAGLIDRPAGSPGRRARRIEVTAGQLDYERRLLAAKLAVRDPSLLAALEGDPAARAHPLFRRTAGEVESWERIKAALARGEPGIEAKRRAGSRRTRLRGESFRVKIGGSEVPMLSLPIANTDETYEIRPSKIIALGQNYRDHIAESISIKVQGLSTAEPAEPVLFAMTPNVLVGPGEPIVIPALLDDYHFPEPRVDYEAELAFIVLDECKNVAPEDAYDHIFAFTCMNDVSQRNVQNGERGGWFRGKSFDTFGPVGPVLVRMQDIGDPQDLRIECRLNGKSVQSSNTKNMIFGIKELFAFVSRNFRLQAGDLITTGTPSGVGAIVHGDVVEVEIERIGVLSNPVVEESRSGS